MGERCDLGGACLFVPVRTLPLDRPLQKWTTKKTISTNSHYHTLPILITHMTVMISSSHKDTLLRRRHRMIQRRQVQRVPNGIAPRQRRPFNVEASATVVWSSVAANT